MSSVILTLQVPRGNRGIPVATSSNTQLLHHFRLVVLDEARQRMISAVDQVEALLAELELERLRKSLDLLILESQS